MKNVFDYTLQRGVPKQTKPGRSDGFPEGSTPPGTQQPDNRDTTDPEVHPILARPSRRRRWANNAFIQTLIMLSCLAVAELRMSRFIGAQKRCRYP
jgi:hypothetical protein